MFALLLGAGIIYLLLGDHLEALLLLIFASLSVGIAVIQEARSERVLEALRDLTSPRALVIRDGQRQRVAGRAVVRGDLLVVSEGDRVAADAALIEVHELQVDELLLTGESVPVHKRRGLDVEPDMHPGGDDTPYVYSGTLVVRGQGLAIVRRTGPQSEIGRIGQTLEAIETAPANLSRQTAAIVRVAATIGLVCCILVILLFGLLRGSWIDALLAGIALGMSMLPEEFPLVLTVFMVMGAWRMSQGRVLTRRAAAIEMLGEATVLCTDKTGTLTENRMAVAVLQATGNPPFAIHGSDIPAHLRHMVEVAALASANNAYDPMDHAVQSLATTIDRSRTDGNLVKVYGVQPDRLAFIQAWRNSPDGMFIAAKGAPEAIAQLCGLDEISRIQLLREADRLAEDGMRVLAVAEASAVGEPAEDPSVFDFHLLGLVGLADRLRDSVPAAVAQCRAANIRVVMITGDYPVTARAIARQAGLDCDRVLDGAAVAQMDDADFQAAVGQVTVFARIMPNEKLRIVRALRAIGESSR